MATKKNPGAFDCYANAKPDEPLFTLLGRDKAAAAAVRYWALERLKTGKNRADDTQIIEAFECARAMDEYREDKPAPVAEGADLV